MPVDFTGRADVAVIRASSLTAKETTKTYVRTLSSVVWCHSRFEHFCLALCVVILCHM